MSLIEKQLVEEREHWEDLFAQKEEDLWGLEEKVREIIRQESEARQRSENRLVQSIEDKSDIIWDEIQREQEHRENSVNRLVEFWQVDLVRMEERIRGLVKDREEMEQALLK